MRKQSCRPPRLLCLLCIQSSSSNIPNLSFFIPASFSLFLACFFFFFSFHCTSSPVLPFDTLSSFLFLVFPLLLTLLFLDFCESNYSLSLSLSLTFLYSLFLCPACRSSTPQTDAEVRSGVKWSVNWAIMWLPWRDSDRVIQQPEWYYALLRLWDFIRSLADPTFAVCGVETRPVKEAINN